MRFLIMSWSNRFVVAVILMILVFPYGLNFDESSEELNGDGQNNNMEAEPNRYVNDNPDETSSKSRSPGPLALSDVDKWLQRALPSARSEHAMVFDDTNSHLYMYGGWDLSNELSDLWRFDVATDAWEDVNDGTNPGGRHDHSMIFESTTSKIYLFGGHDGDSMKNDLWMYNITSYEWVLVDSGSGTAPDPRNGHGMVYDSARHLIYIFGGTDGPTYFNDIWKFDLLTGAWTEVTVALEKPPGRTGLSMIYDSVNNRIYMFGGFDSSNYLDDLWRFEVGISAWSEIDPAGTEKPPERSDHTMVFDSSNNRIYLFGGIYLTITIIKEYRPDFWYYDIGGNQWHQPEDGPAPSSRARHAMAIDNSNNEIYILEGYSGVFREDFWKYKINTNRWDNIYDSSPVQSPSIRNGQGLTYDPVLNVLHYFGGYYNDGQPHYRGDMWEFDFATERWAIVNEGTGPKARFARGVSYDSANHEIYMFGGYYYDYNLSTRNYLNDLWLYNITTYSWQEVNDGVIVPEPRDGHTMIYDPSTGDIYLHGGRKWLSGPNYKYYGDLWKYNIAGQSWTNLTDSTTISARSRQEMAFDSRHGDIYIFGGYNETGYNNETWRYNIATNNWTKLTTGGDDPSPRGAMDLVYDKLNDNIYMFSGKDDDDPLNILNEFYMFNVSTQNWTQLSLPAGAVPTPRLQYGFVYNHISSVIYLSGGYYYDSGNVFYADLWEYDVTTGNWTELLVKRPYPSPNLDCKMASAGGSTSTLYLYGGWDGEKYLDKLWKYDIGTDQFSEAAANANPRPEGRRAHDLVSTGDGSTLYLFGGNNGTMLNDIWKYDISSETWELIIPGSNKPSGRKQFSMVSGGNNKIFLFGGWNGISLGDFWEYDIGSESWNEITGSAPSARQRHAMAADISRGYIYLFGGFDSSFNYKNDLWRFDTTSGTWSQITGFVGSAPKARDSTSLFYEPITNCLFVFGGSVDTTTWLDDLHKFDIDNNLWIKVDTSEAAPSPRHSFGYSYDGDSNRFFLFGGWSNFYKCDLWNWELPISAGIKDIAVELSNGDGTDNKTVFAKRILEYEFVVKVKDRTSYMNLDYVNLQLGDVAPVIHLRWTEADDTFTEFSDSSNYVILTDASYSVHDSSQGWTLHFKVIFNWVYPTEYLQPVEIIAENDDGLFEWFFDTSGIYHVENDLDLIGTLIVTGETQGVLTHGDWVRKSEHIAWENLTVVYQGTTDVYPYDEEYDVTVWDDDGNYWSDPGVSGDPIYIDSTADNQTDLSEDFTINISRIPAENDISSLTFSLKVDADPVEFSDQYPTSSDLNNAVKVKCGINVTDGLAGESSGVDADTIEYSISTNGGATWGAWTSAGLSGTGSLFSAEVKPEFANSFHNYIRWRATDAVGNEISYSGNYRVLVDTSFSPSAPTTLLLSPYNTLKVLGLKPTFAWSGEDPDGDDITYDLYVGLDIQKVRDRDSSVRVASGLDYPFHTLTSPLMDDLTYYWTVIPHDETYTGRCLSDVWNFTVTRELATSPTTYLTTPTDGDIRAKRTVYLEWNVNQTKPGMVSNLIIVYIKDYDLAETSPSKLVPVVEFKTAQGSVLFETPELEDNTIYHWFVIPHQGEWIGECVNGPFSFIVDTSYKPIYNLTIQAPKDLTVKPGETTESSFTVKNNGNEQDGFYLNIYAGDIEDYITVKGYNDEIRLASGEELRVELEISLPINFQPGDYEIKIGIRSYGSDEDTTFTVDVTVPGEPVTGGDTTDEEGLSALAIAGLGIMIVVIVIVVVVFFVMTSKKKKKALEAEALTPGAAPAVPGQVSAEVSYIPKGAFGSERAAFAAVAGQAEGAVAPPDYTTGLPSVAGGPAATGAEVTPVETLPPQPPEEEPLEQPMELPEVPESPYEGAVTESPVEPPSPEGWEPTPELPPAASEQVQAPAEDEIVRYDTGEGPPPEVPEPEPEPEPEPPQRREPPPEETTEEYYQQQQYQQPPPPPPPPQPPAQPQYPQYVACMACGAQMPYGYTNCTYCGSALSYM